ncbi:MAG TPA: hypothetical protein V6C89_06505 [Drouetiella sp.]|jgi:hypothetical protein
MTDDKYRSGGSDPLSKRILNSIKPFSGEQTSKWLAALSTDAVKDAVVIKNDSDPAQEPPRSMAAWVDGLFDHFQRYAYDFSSMCTDSELQVNCTRPTLQEPKGPSSLGGAPDTSVVSLGYLSTYKWALVVRGEYFRIQVYVVPVGVLMGFKARHEEFPLYMEMIAAQAPRNKVNWTLDGKPVSMDQASAIAKRLFAHLIMVARGEASDTDKFSLTQKPASVPDASLPARPSSFGTSDNKVELLKPEWLLEENPSRPARQKYEAYTPLSQQLPPTPLDTQQPSLQQAAPQQQQNIQQRAFPAQPQDALPSQQPLPPHLQQQLPPHLQSQQQQSSSGQYGGSPFPTQSQHMQSSTGSQGMAPVQPFPAQKQQPHSSSSPHGSSPVQPFSTHSQQQQSSTGAQGMSPLQPFPAQSQQQQSSTGQQGISPLQSFRAQSQQPQSLSGPHGQAQFPPPVPQGQQNGAPQFRQSQESQSQTGPQQFFANQQAAAQNSSRPGDYPKPQISAVNPPAPSSGAAPISGQVRGNVQDLLQQNLVLVLNECNQFAGALDQQLELLTPIGVKSIQDHDMDTASEVMQRAKKLKALLDAVVSFTNDWKNNSK